MSNNDVSDVTFATEYRYVTVANLYLIFFISFFFRLEFYSPPYMIHPRPTYTGLPSTVDYNAKFQLKVDLPVGVKSISGRLFYLVRLEVKF